MEVGRLGEVVVSGEEEEEEEEVSLRCSETTELRAC